MVKATDLRLEPELTEVKDWYLELPNPQKQRFLGAIGHDLTLSFRGYKEDAILNPKFWFGVNELHHALYGAINALGAEVAGFRVGK